MFYFYNNGIVLICDSAENSPISLSVRLKGASIVNGCQTVTVLANLFFSGSLNPDVDLLMRIIVIDSYDQRAKITEYLNTQTPIKESYFISNNPIIRELQRSLKDKGYFLERQINEKHYKKTHGEEVSDDLKVIQLESVIQYYTGYWIDKYAYMAKREKKSLFDKERIEEILSEISSDKVIESYESYLKVARIITMYRKNRRNPENDEFSNYLGISQESYVMSIDDYRFINTSDILILNISRLIKEKYINENRTVDVDGIIIKAISVCKDAIKEHQNGDSSSSLANITKNQPIFALSAKIAKCT